MPNRKTDGYGLNNRIIEKFYEANVKLIFTVDNGISAFNEIEYAKKLGIDTVVTDHHMPPEKLPVCSAVVDPYRKGCSSHFKNFAGVGVAFKAILALEQDNKNFNEILEEYSDIVAIGTIADSIELTGESRNLVRLGIQQISKEKRAFIKLVLKFLNCDTFDINSTFLMFSIVPRINAAGRMGDANRAVKLLLSENTGLSKKIFEDIESDNELRKQIEKNIIEQVVERFSKTNNLDKFQKILIITGENWHHGVLGIAASRITEKYGKPSILITVEGELSRASCRSVEDFSIYEALSKCSDLFERFGGHSMAAGFTLRTENIEKFKNKILKILDNDYENIPSCALNIDCTLKPEEINCKLIDDINILEPFGTGNKKPTFGIFFAELVRIKEIGNGKHLKLTFKKNYCDFKTHEKNVFETVLFNKSQKNFLYEVGETLDLAVTLEKNQFLGETSASIFINDLKLSGLDDDYLIKEKILFERFKLGKNFTESEKIKFLPSRAEFVLVYSYLNKTKNFTQRPDVIFSRLKKKVRMFRIYAILDVLEELGIIEIFWNSDEFNFKIVKINKKVDLESSKSLKLLKI